MRKRLRLRFCRRPTAEVKPLESALLDAGRNRKDSIMENNENGEATPQGESSETSAVSMMTGTGEVTAADLEAQLLQQDAEAEENQNAGDDDNADNNGGDNDNQNAEENADTEKEETNTDENTESESDTENEDEEEEESDGTLSPELQSVIDKRIGKEVAKRKGLEETLGSERKQTEQLQEQVTSLTKQLEDTPLPSVPGTHPLLTVESEKDIEAWEEDFWQFRKWARKHHESGYEGEDDKGNTITYTPEDIEARLEQLTEEKERFLPKARELLGKRGEFEAKAKELYPALQDRKNPEYGEMLSILRAVPALKQLPDYKIVVGDLLRGRKARLAKSASSPSKDKKVKLKKQPPKVPVHNAPGNGNSLSASGGDTGNQGINTRRLVEMGGDQNALEELLFQSS
jgi:hypothetical protein